MLISHRAHESSHDITTKSDLARDRTSVGVIFITPDDVQHVVVAFQDSRVSTMSGEDGVPLRRTSSRFGRPSGGGGGGSPSNTSSSSSGSNNPFLRAESELRDIPVGMLNNGYYERFFKVGESLGCPCKIRNRSCRGI